MPDGWDCHVHVFDAAAPSRAGHYRPVDRPLAQIEGIAHEHGVRHLVLVQPSVYGTDNTVLLNALALEPGRHRGVAVVSDDVADAELDEMHAAGVRGVRLNLVSPVGEGVDPARRFAVLARRVQRLGWHLQWYTNAAQLPRVAELHLASDVTCVLDHLAGFGAKVADDHPAWRAAEVLAARGAWLKLSGWYRLDAHAPYASLVPPHPAPRRPVRRPHGVGLGLAAHEVPARGDAAVHRDLAARCRRARPHRRRSAATPSSADLPVKDKTMQLTGLMHGAALLRHVDFPTAEVLGPDATEDEIAALIKRHGQVFVKPLFKGGVGKKGKSGLIGRAKDLRSALAEKERLYFAEHRHGNAVAKANGVTFEGGVPAEHEIYFSITDDTRFRAPAITITHKGGVDIEELGKGDIATVPFDALTGLKAFVIANALADIGAPKEVISPLVQHLPKLWELMHHYGMTTLELNPIRMRPDGNGRLTPVACDFKCGFDRDDPRVARLKLPGHLFAADIGAFEQEVNELRTHQGQSDVFVINERGTILAPTFGGGANSLVTEVLGEAASISLGLRRQSAVREDEGGRPHLLPPLPCAEQRAVHHRRQVEQHRHPRDAARDGRCAARARLHARADAALRRRRPRRAEPGARLRRAGRHLRGARPAVPLLRLRQRDLARS